MVPFPCAMLQFICSFVKKTGVNRVYRLSASSISLRDIKPRRPQRHQPYLSLTMSPVQGRKVPYGWYSFLEKDSDHRNEPEFDLMRSSIGKVRIESVQDHLGDHAVWRPTVAGVGPRGGRSHPAYQGRVSTTTLSIIQFSSSESSLIGQVRCGYPDFRHCQCMYACAGFMNSLTDVSAPI
jgi:hypothetical protein